MRLALYIAALALIAGCTTKTVEREIHYVPVPATNPPPAQPDRQQQPIHTRDPDVIRGLAYCWFVLSIIQDMVPDENKNLVSEYMEIAMERSFDYGNNMDSDTYIAAYALDRATYNFNNDKERFKADAKTCISVLSDMR